jgi:hypothetical protein
MALNTVFIGLVVLPNSGGTFGLRPFNFALAILSFSLPVILLTL